jgi:hypothetical protein
VGKGESGTVTDADGPWTSWSYTNFEDAYLNFDEVPPVEGWSLTFDAPQGTELTPGFYPGAGSSSSGGSPGIDISHDHRGCGGGRVGEFTVTHVQYDVYAIPIRFAATFLQRCDADDPKLTGSIDHSFDGTLGTADLTPGNILVTFENLLYEYTPTGTLVQVMPIARQQGGPPAIRFNRYGVGARDLVMDAAGRVHIYNDLSHLSFIEAALSSFDPVAGTWTHDKQHPDWNVIGGDGNGSVAAFGDFIFSNDMSYSGDASGIIRFDASGGTATQRFADGQPYVDLSVGFDGRLYAMRGDYGSRQVDVFDPQTLMSLGSITLDRYLAGFAVNALGEIFGVSSGTIYKLDPSGTTQASYATAFSGFFEIDLTRDGQIVIGTSEFGYGPAEFIISDDSLTSASRFEIDPSSSRNHTFVAFVQAPPSVVFSSNGFESGDTASWSKVAGGSGGFLSVNGSSAATGSYGLEVDVAAVCTAANDLVLTSPPTIEGTFLGCNSITASGVEVGGAGATFAAGSRILLGDHFSVAGGTPFKAVIDPGLLSGLAYVEDDSPGNTVSYNARFSLNIDNLTLADGDLLEHFNGYSGNGTEQFRLILRRNVGLSENRLALEVREDSGSYATTLDTSEVVLASGWRTIHVAWQAGDGDGYLTIWVDGVLSATLSGLDNDQQSIGFVRWGEVGGTMTTTSGSMALDDFFSWF